MVDSADEARRQQAGEALDRALALLPMENPETSHAGDARRWVQVYRELVALKDDLLRRLDEALPGMRDEVRLEIAQTDATMLRHQRDHYLSRLDFWEHRHWELHKLDLDPVARIVRHGELEAQLTRREVALLQCLMERPGTYLSAQQILHMAWGDSRLHTEEVRTYVARLRRRLLDIKAPTRIVTRPRRGYALVHDE
jgi:DNA-binding response OmpR family regulator